MGWQTLDWVDVSNDEPFENEGYQEHPGFCFALRTPPQSPIPGDDPVSLRRCRCELLVVLSTCVRFRPWAHGTRAVKIPRKCFWGKQNNVVAFLGYRAAFVRGSRVAHVCGEKDGVRARTLCVGVRNRLRTSRRSGFAVDPHVQPPAGATKDFNFAHVPSLFPALDQSRTFISRREVPKHLAFPTATEKLQTAPA